MKISQFFLGPEGNLSKEQLEALLAMKAGVPLTDSTYLQLELADLIEKGLGGWVLTKAGEFRLAAGK
jgi:hypothetical protein